MPALTQPKDVVAGPPGVNTPIPVLLCTIIRQMYEQNNRHPRLALSTVHGQTVENNRLTDYTRLYWNMNILGHQRFVNSYS